MTERHINTDTNHVNENVVVVVAIDDVATDHKMTSEKMSIDGEQNIENIKSIINITNRNGVEQMIETNGDLDEIKEKMKDDILEEGEIKDSDDDDGDGDGDDNGGNSNGNHDYTKVDNVEVTNVDDHNNDDNNVDHEAIRLRAAFTTLLNNVNIEYSFGTFLNWFLPSCMDVWSSSSSVSSSTQSETTSIIAYGARSFLFLLKVIPSSSPSSSSSHVPPLSTFASGLSIKYYDLINVFGHVAQKKYVDVFRQNNTYITTVVFDKHTSNHHKLSTTEQPCHTTTTINPRVLVGNSDGAVALYNVGTRQTMLQDVPFHTLKRSCCRHMIQSKILSAIWLHFRDIGAVVFYTLDTHLIRWEVDRRMVVVQHDGDEPCGQQGRLLGQLQIACLASMSAETITDRSEHKLAVGYMSGKIAIFAFDPISGRQKSFTILADNAHNDDLCSLTFSPYSLNTTPSYRRGLLCSISRDSVLKVWSCANGYAEIAEHRINQTQHNNSLIESVTIQSSGHRKHHQSHHHQPQCNWFAAAFLPRTLLHNKSSVDCQTGGGSTAAANKQQCAYEILITSNTGELVTITIPDRELNCKLRIMRSQKFVQSYNHASASSISSSSSSSFTSRGSASKSSNSNVDELFLASTANMIVDQSHSSVIFSIIIDPIHGLAVTYSLDYKMILWSLRSRMAIAQFHLFSNGALSVDCCEKDRRIAVAFGNSIYTMDFIQHNPLAECKWNINASRCMTAFSKDCKFYQVSWNNVSNSERLGQLVMGTSTGETYMYDLNTRQFVYKSSKWNTSGNKQRRNATNKEDCKIYRFVWPVKLPVLSKSTTTSTTTTTTVPFRRPIVASLHKNGQIFVHYLPSTGTKMYQINGHAPENFITGKFVSDLPEILEKSRRKHTAIDEFDSGCFVVLGNDDGTIDVLKAIDDDSGGGGGNDHNNVEAEISAEIPAKATGATIHDNNKPIYRHLFRFRAFTKPILSIETCSKTKWMAITALHDNTIYCVQLCEQDLLLQQDTIVPDNESNADDDSNTCRIVQISPERRRKLIGHQDRVSGSSWCPFNRSLKESNDEPLKSLLVTASYDTTCIVWLVEQAQPVKRFFGHRSLIYTIRWSHFSPDLIFSGGEDCFHCWDWTVQPEYQSEMNQFLGKSMVEVQSLKKNVLPTTTTAKANIITAAVSSNGDNMQTNHEFTGGGSKNSKSSKISSSGSLSAKSNVASIFQHATITTGSTSASAKPLFALSNQIENNSTKIEILDDIIHIFKMRQFYLHKQDNQDQDKPKLTDIIPERKLNRILFYGNVEEIKRFVHDEQQNHRKHGHVDAAEMLELFVGNVRQWLIQRLEQQQQNQCGPPVVDMVMANLAAAFSRDLWKQCLQAIISTTCSSMKINNNSSQQSTGSRPIHQKQTNSPTTTTMWSTYWRETVALMRLYCMADFDGCIDSLLDSSTFGTALYREALVLARIHYASPLTIGQLWYRWYEQRLSTGGNQDSAVKCLVACDRYKEATQVLEQRRALCTDTSANAVLDKYDEVIRLLKSFDTSPPPPSSSSNITNDTNIDDDLELIKSDQQQQQRPHNLDDDDDDDGEDQFGKQKRKMIKMNETDELELMEM